MNTKRVSKGAGSLLQRLWNGALNALNAADLGLHVLYAAALFAEVPAGPAAAAAFAAGAGSLAALAALDAAGTASAPAPSRVAVPEARAAAVAEPESPELDASLGRVRGHTVVVTGASSGIGFEVVRQLLEQGAHVVVLCRDESSVKARRASPHAPAPQLGRCEVFVRVTTASRPSRPQATITALRERARAAPPALGALDGLACDLSSLASARAAGERVRERHPAVDALVLCAGTALWGSAERQVTNEGIEVHLAVNHLSHAEHVSVLTPALVAGAARRGRRSRVVLVSSTAAWWTPQGELEQALEAHAEGPEAAARHADAQQRGSGPWAPYSISKARRRGVTPCESPSNCGGPLHVRLQVSLTPLRQRAMALYARALGARLGSSAQAPVAVAVHPGIAPTRLQRHMGPLGAALQGALWFLGFSPEKCAAPAPAAFHDSSARESGVCAA